MTSEAIRSSESFFAQHERSQDRGDDGNHQVQHGAIGGQRAGDSPRHAKLGEHLPQHSGQGELAPSLTTWADRPGLARRLRISRGTNNTVVM